MHREHPPKLKDDPLEEETQIDKGEDSDEEDPEDCPVADLPALEKEIDLTRQKLLPNPQNPSLFIPFFPSMSPHQLQRPRRPSLLKTPNEPSPIRAATIHSTTSHSHGAAL